MGGLPRQSVSGQPMSIEEEILSLVMWTPLPSSWVEYVEGGEDSEIQMNMKARLE